MSFYWALSPNSLLTPHRPTTSYYLSPDLLTPLPITPYSGPGTASSATTVWTYSITTAR
ncbi:hypothetical protein B484DRAFT_449223 [Ochromonadaceae sp. CCMP2298]|nr:hypothetical protein B484DRAFT_449223 [Ochromonadaceae sp. CCMP2298]